MSADRYRPWAARAWGRRRAAALLWIAVAATACERTALESGVDAGVDLAASPDMVPAMQCPTCGGDICVNLLADSQHCGACGHACTSAEKCRTGVCAGGGDRQFVVDWIYLPNTQSEKEEFAADLNGDGTVDNRFFQFLTTLKSFGIELQNNLTNLMWSGQTIYLVEIPRVGVPDEPAAIFQAVPTYPMQPNLWGGGTFSIEANSPPTLFVGTPKDTSFSAVVPVGASPPLWRLMVSSPDTKAFFRLPLWCHQISAIIDGNGGHLDVLLQGSIKRIDLLAGFAVDVAKYMTSILKAKPETVQPGLQNAIRTLLDTGGEKGTCTDVDGSEGIADDNLISPCELYENPTMKKAFEPDLQVYDQNGAFNPQKKPTIKDSLSFGIRISATYAKFQ